MHRSGTSLAAGIARLAGLDLGRNLLVGDAAENPRGFWEHRDVLAIDEELLAAISLAWSVPCPLPEGWLDHPRVAPLLERAEAMLKREFAGSPAWAIKDPRLSRLWPFWERAGAGVSDEIGGLLVYRHPLEVAASLAARDSMPLEQALQGWLLHNVEAVGLAAEHRLQVMRLAGLLADPVAAAGRLRLIVGLEEPLPEETRRQIERFVDAGLIHHRDPGSLPDTPTGRLTAEAIAYLDRLAEEGGDTAVVAEAQGAMAEIGQRLGELVAGRQRTAAGRPATVDVIVPVHGGGEATIACIDSVLAGGGACELIVIDDASPEAELSATLAERAGRGEFTLLSNAANLGFVASANRGLALHPDRDVVLLNSDTLVPPGWLERLGRAAGGDRIGTATPFSNNATLASYPVAFQDNPLPAGWSAVELDEVFQAANAGWTIDIPTAVGFCMYLRRDCLAEVGLFDEKDFGRGYGEETDFCMRARAAGWRHVLAADLFVFHRGQESFGGAAEHLREQAAATMRTKHPGYESLIVRFQREDPLAAAREAADAARVARRGEAELRRLLVDHRVATAARLAGIESEAESLRGAAGRLDRALGNAQRIVAERTAEVTRLSEALAEAQGLATDRLAALGRRDAALAEATDLADAHLAEAHRLDQALAEAERIVAERTAEVTRLSEALAEATDLADAHLAEAHRLDQALAEAERIVAERTAEVTRLSEALAEATDLADAHLAEAHRLDQALAEAERIVAERTAETVQLSEALADAEGLATERLAELASRDAGLADAERIVAERTAETIRLSEALAEAAGLAETRLAEIHRLASVITEIEQLALERLATSEALDRQLRETATALAATEDLARERLARIESLTRQVEVFTAGLEQAGRRPR